MSEWIDFIIYALQAAALWILMPRWGVRMSLPLLRDRNAAWVDANPDVLASARPGGWFLKACYAWAAFTVAVLLVFLLDLQPQRWLPEALATPRWKILMSTNSLLLAMGMIGYFSGAAVFMRWVAKTVPQSEHRAATLRPRATEDYAPRWLRKLVHVAIGIHVLAWIYAGASGLFHNPRYWGACTAIMGMTVVACLLGQYSVLRRPSWMDSDRGYRRAEILLMYVVQLCLVAFGAVALSQLLLGVDLRRACTLGFALFVFITVLVVMRPPARNGAGGAAQNGSVAVN